jgi:hypothetical protein
MELEEEVKKQGFKTFTDEEYRNFIDLLGKKVNKWIEW